MSFSLGDQTWLPLVRKWKGKKILQGKGKVREFHFSSGKILYLWNKSGENEVLRVHAY